MKSFVNGLSIFRIAAAFAIVPMMLHQWFLISFIVFVLACFSDLFDGILAKKYNVATKIGGVLDHMGDKFLIVNALILMVLFTQTEWVIYPAIIMIARELYVSGLREFLGTQKIEMPVQKPRLSMAKAKTFIQMVALGAMFLWVLYVNTGFGVETFSKMHFPYYYILMMRDLLYAAIAGLWLATIASVWSATEYTVDFAKKYKQIKK